MNLVHFYSYYCDLQELNVVDKIIMQRNRDAYLYHQLHELYNLPRFPMSQEELNSHHGTLIHISRANKQLHMLFVDGDCMVLHMGAPYFYESREAALQAILNNKIK